jgi:hypothetical protein
MLVESIGYPLGAAGGKVLFEAKVAVAFVPLDLELNPKRKISVEVSNELVEAVIFVQILPGGKAIEGFKDKLSSLITFVFRYMAKTVGFDLLKCFFRDGLLCLTCGGHLFGKLKMITKSGLLVNVTARLLLEGGSLELLSGWKCRAAEAIEAFFVFGLSLLERGSVSIWPFVGEGYDICLHQAR